MGIFSFPAFQFHRAAQYPENRAFPSSKASWLIFSYRQDTPFSQPQIRHLLPSSPSRPPIYPILRDLSRSLCFPHHCLSCCGHERYFCHCPKLPKRATALRNPALSVRSADLKTPFSVCFASWSKPPARYLPLPLQTLVCQPTPGGCAQKMKVCAHSPYGWRSHQSLSTLIEPVESCCYSYRPRC